jgi:hypothetical protein
MAPRAGVQPAVDEHAIEPALEDGRRAEPPQRELQHDEVGGQDLVDLAAHVGRK